MNDDGKVFVDTNILVYAYDQSVGAKQEKAAMLVTELWSSPLLPAVSVQVLQEFFVCLVRRQVDADEAGQIVQAYFDWDLVDNTKGLLAAALKEQKRFKISFWDSCILAAARSAACVEIWSEDFNSGQSYAGITAVNPFK